MEGDKQNMRNKENATLGIQSVYFAAPGSRSVHAEIRLRASVCVRNG